MADEFEIPLVPQPPGEQVPPGAGQPFRPTFPPAPSPPVTPEPVPAPVPAPEPQPVGPTGGLPDLGWLAMLLVILGLIAAAAALVEFLNWLFRTMLGPLWSRTGRKQLDTPTILQPLSNALGNAYAGIDEEIGLGFVTLAQSTNRIGQAILAGEQAAYTGAVKLAAIAGNLTGAQHKTGSALAQAQQARHAAHEAQRQARQDAKIAAASHDALLARVKTLEHNVTHLIEPELDTLRDKIPHLEKGATVAWDEIQKHEGLLGIGAFTAATAVALGRLGGGWIRCETTQELGRAACRSNSNNWRKLLKGSLDVLGIVEMCASLRLIVKVSNSSVITDGLGFFSAGLGDLLKCTGATRPTPLDVPAPSVAPPSSWASLTPTNV